MEQSMEISIPLQHNAKLYSDDGTREVDDTLDCQLLGILNYLTTIMLDIVYSVSILIQFMARPIEVHWRAAKRVLRYLKGTINFGIKYTDDFNVELAGYSDSDSVENPDEKQSTLGYAFNLGFGIVAWCNKKQPIVSLSLTEVEYRSLCNVTCEAVWLR